MIGYNTKAIIVGQTPDKSTGAIIPPIFLNSTYDQNQAEELEFFYSRGENPTRFAVEQTLSALDNAKFGLTFSSGQAAGMAVLNLLTPGDRVLSINDVYGGTYALFKQFELSNNIVTDLVEFTTIEEVQNGIHPLLS